MRDVSLAADQAGLDRNLDHEMYQIPTVGGYDVLEAVLFAAEFEADDAPGIQITLIFDSSMQNRRFGSTNAFRSRFSRSA